MADVKPEMKRDSTMQATVKEGIRFLKEAGETVLLEMQELMPSDGSADGSVSVGDSVQKSKMQRDSTMAITIKEGEQFLKEHDKKNNVEAETIDASSKGSNETKKGAETKKGGGKPKMAKISTMMQTKKEGEAFLAAQTEKAENENNKDSTEKAADEEPPSKKSKTDKGAKSTKPNNKRLNTIEAVAKEGEELLKRMGGVKNSDVTSERRVTRAQSRGESAPPPLPVVSKKGAKQNDAKNEPKKRGRSKKESAAPLSDVEEKDTEDGKDIESDEEVEKIGDATKDTKADDKDAEEAKEEKEEIEESQENVVKAGKKGGKKETAAQKRKNNVGNQKKKAATV